MARDLNKKPLNLAPMIALSADIRREYGKDPDKPQGADIWRKRNGSLDKIEEIAAGAVEDPRLLGELAIDALHFVRDQRRLARRYLRVRFGVKVVPFSYVPGETEPRLPPVRFWKPDRICPTLTDQARLRGALYGYMLFESLWWSMNYATQQAYKALLCDEIVCSYLTKKYAMWGSTGRVVKADRQRNYTAEAALFAYLHIMRNAPILLAAYISHREGPPGERRLEELAAGVVSGWVRSKIKLYPELRKALAEEGDPRKVLLRELPGAVLSELAEMKREDVRPAGVPGKTARLGYSGSGGAYKLLVNRVANQLRTSGGTQQGGIDLDQQPGEQELAEFAERELLDQLIENAGLSKQEQEVFLLSATLNNKEIAERLERSKNQVAQEKHRATKKARRAAGL